MTEELLEITRPDDAHVHLRDGAALSTTVPATAAQFGRALVMPNLVPPATTVAEALEYRGRIIEARPGGSGFEPLMALYLTDRTTLDEVRRAADCAEVLAFKLYPSGATTNSEFGVTDLAGRRPIFELMAELGVTLCVHGEETATEVDVFDRERVFLDKTLLPLVEQVDSLRVVFEHITTAEAARFVESAREGVAGSITPQHLLMNRNDLLVGGVHPHHYCLPVLKRRTHQEELQRVATGGNPRFFLGTDSAPHSKGRKESACGCAGCYSAPAAIELYAQVFDQLGALDQLEGFASHHAADFYGLPRNSARVTLKRERWTVPAKLPFEEGDEIVPYWAERELDWRLA